MLPELGGGPVATLPPPPPKPKAPAPPPTGAHAGPTCPLNYAPDRVGRGDHASPIDRYAALGGVGLGALNNLNEINGHLPPNATLTENGYTFKTDAQGRVTSAEGRLTANPKTGAARDPATRAAQREVGWEDRLPDDHGGHVIADRFNGPGNFKNLFAQNGNFNLGEYKKVENGFATAMQAGKSVDVKISLNYAAGSLRPHGITVTSRIDSGPIKTHVFENGPGGRAASDAAEAADGAASTGSKLAKASEVFGKVAVPVAVVADGYSLYQSYEADGGRVGEHTVEQAGSVAGGWAGAVVGAETGAEAGAAVGAFFGGVGAAPGAVVGGIVGGVVGSVAGSTVGKDVVKAGSSIVHGAKSAFEGVKHFFGW